MAIAIPLIPPAISLAQAAWATVFVGSAAATAVVVHQAVKKTDEQAKTESKAVPDACATCPSPECKNLREEIEKFMRELNERAQALNTNPGNLPLEKPAVPHERYGFRSIKGEQQQFQDKQQAIRNRLEKYRKNNCGPPPDKAVEYTNLATPSTSNPVTPPPLP